MKMTITRLTALLLAAGITISAHAETLVGATESSAAPTESAEQQEKTSAEEKQEKNAEDTADEYDYYYNEGNRYNKEFTDLSLSEKKELVDEFLKYILKNYSKCDLRVYDNDKRAHGYLDEYARKYTKELQDSLSELYDYIYTSCTYLGKDQGVTCSFDKEDLNYFVDMEIRLPDVQAAPYLTLILNDNNMTLNDCFGRGNNYTVQDPEKIVDMVYDISMMINPPEEKEIKIKKENVNLDNMTYNGDKMQCLEKLTFTIPADKGVRRSFIGALANEGEALKFTVTQAKTDKWTFFMMIEGSKGKKVMWTENSQYSTGSYKAYEEFYETETIDGNHNLVLDYNNPANNSIMLKGSADDETITDINLKLTYNDGIGNLKDLLINGENVSYEFYGKDYTVEGGRNLYTILSLTYEKVQKELEEKKQEEKNNQYADQTKTILFKGYTDDKSMYLDYKVLFAAQADLDVEEAVAPKWYKELGSDVKVTILSLMRRIDGKEKRPPYLLMRLKGSEKSRWFKIDSETPSKNLSNEDTEYLGDLHYDMEFRSVKSFDGKNLVGQDYSDSDIIHASIRFDYAEPQSVLSGIDFTIESQKTEVDAENLKYIGGGRTLYENIFYSTDGDTYYGNN